MKRVRILLAMLTAVVLATSCATTQDTVDDNFDETTTRRVGDRVYVNDPFYGTVVSERDPFTGRYFDVTYGYSRFGSPYYNSPYFRGGGFGGGYYNRSPRRLGGSVRQRPAQQQPSQESRREARGKILGN